MRLAAASVKLILRRTQNNAAAREHVAHRGSCGQLARHFGGFAACRYRLRPHQHVDETDQIEQVYVVVLIEIERTEAIRIR